ncbi:MAG: ECF transporter S component [Candidatus Izemoplasmatales bacterium]
MENNQVNCVKRRTTPVRWLALVAILGTMSAVIMLAEFAIPFLGPSFLKLDLSEVPVMIGAFALGPIAGIAIEGIKITVNLLIEGTLTWGIGELANFLIGIAFVLPASLVYRFHRTRGAALIGLAAGTFVMTAAGALLNWYVLLPWYAGLMGLSLDDLILQFSIAIPYITDVRTGILFGIVPFNVFKGLVISAIVIVIYKRVSPLIKGRDVCEDSD